MCNFGGNEAGGEERAVSLSSIPGPRQWVGHSSEGIGDPKRGCGPLPETPGIYPPGWEENNNPPP